jgi:hypothetical protein
MCGFPGPDAGVAGEVCPFCWILGKGLAKNQQNAHCDEKFCGLHNSIFLWFINGLLLPVVRVCGQWQRWETGFFFYTPDTINKRF